MLSPSFCTIQTCEIQGDIPSGNSEEDSDNCESEENWDKEFGFDDTTEIGSSSESHSFRTLSMDKLSSDAQTSEKSIYLGETKSSELTGFEDQLQLKDDDEKMKILHDCFIVSELLASRRKDPYENFKKHMSLVCRPQRDGVREDYQLEEISESIQMHTRNFYELYSSKMVQERAILAKQAIKFSQKQKRMDPESWSKYFQLTFLSNKQACHRIWNKFVKALWQSLQNHKNGQEYSSQMTNAVLQIFSLSVKLRCEQTFNDSSHHFWQKKDRTTSEMSQRHEKRLLKAFVEYIPVAFHEHVALFQLSAAAHKVIKSIEASMVDFSRGKETCCKEIILSYVRLYFRVLNDHTEKPQFTVAEDSIMGIRQVDLQIAVFMDILLFIHGFSPLTLDYFPKMVENFTQWKENHTLCNNCLKSNQNSEKQKSAQTTDSSSKKLKWIAPSYFNCFEKIFFGADDSTANESMAKQSLTFQAGDCGITSFSIGCLLQSCSKHSSLYINFLLKTYRGLPPRYCIKEKCAFVLALLMERQTHSKNASAHAVHYFLESSVLLTDHIQDKQFMNLPFLLTTLERLGKMFLCKGKYNISEKFFEICIEGHVFLKNTSEIKRLQRTLGTMAFHHGDKDVALNLYIQMLQTLIEKQNIAEYTYVSNVISDLLISKGQFVEADYYLTTAFQMHEISCGEIEFYEMGSGIMVPFVLEKVHNTKQRRFSLSLPRNEAELGKDSNPLTKMNQYSRQNAISSDGTILYEDESAFPKLSTAQFEIQEKRVMLALKLCRFQHAIILATTLGQCCSSTQQQMQALLLLSRCYIKSNMLTECSLALDNMTLLADDFMKKNGHIYFSSNLQNPTNTTKTEKHDDFGSCSFDSPGRRLSTTSSDKSTFAFSFTSSVINKLYSDEFLEYRARCLLDGTNQLLTLKWLDLASVLCDERNFVCRGQIHYIRAQAYQKLSTSESHGFWFWKSCDAFHLSISFYKKAGDRFHQAKGFSKLAGLYLSSIFEEILQAEVGSFVSAKRNTNLELLKSAEISCFDSLNLAKETAEPLNLLCCLLNAAEVLWLQESDSALHAWNEAFLLLKGVFLKPKSELSCGQNHSNWQKQKGRSVRQSEVSQPTLPFMTALAHTQFPAMNHKWKRVVQIYDLLSRLVRLAFVMHPSPLEDHAELLCSLCAYEQHLLLLRKSEFYFRQQDAINKGIFSWDGALQSESKSPLNDHQYPNNCQKPPFMFDVVTDFDMETRYGRQTRPFNQLHPNQALHIALNSIECSEKYQKIQRVQNLISDIKENLFVKGAIENQPCPNPAKLFFQTEPEILVTPLSNHKESSQQEKMLLALEILKGEFLDGEVSTSECLIQNKQTIQKLIKQLSNDHNAQLASKNSAGSHSQILELPMEFFFLWKSKNYFFHFCPATKRKALLAKSRHTTGISIVNHIQAMSEMNQAPKRTAFCAHAFPPFQPDSCFHEIDYTIALLLNEIGVKGIILALTALLMEQPVVFITIPGGEEQLIFCLAGLLRLLRPFLWCHPYIPLLTNSSVELLLELLSTREVYLIGSYKSVWTQSCKDILDKGMGAQQKSSGSSAEGSDFICGQVTLFDLESSTIDVSFSLSHAASEIWKDEFAITTQDIETNMREMDLHFPEFQWNGLRRCSTIPAIPKLYRFLLWERIKNNEQQQLKGELSPLSQVQQILRGGIEIRESCLNMMVACLKNVDMYLDLQKKCFNSLRFIESCKYDKLKFLQKLVTTKGFEYFIHNRIVEQVSKSSTWSWGISAQQLPEDATFDMRFNAAFDERKRQKQLILRANQQRCLCAVLFVHVKQNTSITGLDCREDLKNLYRSMLEEVQQRKKGKKRLCIIDGPEYSGKLTFFRGKRRMWKAGTIQLQHEVCSLELADFRSYKGSVSQVLDSFMLLQRCEKNKQVTTVFFAHAKTIAENIDWIQLLKSRLQSTKLKTTTTTDILEEERV